jgi:hypothetical protein
MKVSPKVIISNIIEISLECSLKNYLTKIKSKYLNNLKLLYKIVINI